MQQLYTWDETKRQANLEKHGLDFMDADLVFGSRIKLELDSPRIISFRPAKRTEREAYYEWLEHDA
jgi:uncharacterized protein